MKTGRVGSGQFRFTVCQVDQNLNYLIGTQAQTQTTTQLSCSHKNHTNYFSFQLKADHVHSSELADPYHQYLPNIFNTDFESITGAPQQISLSSPTLVTDLMFIFFIHSC